MASDRLTGRKAIVTGAASGIGAATAARLRADGAQVFTADVQGDVDFSGDLTAPEANAHLIEQAVAAMGGLDTLVPCAGISAFHPLEGHDDAYFLRVLEVNLVAVFLLLPHSPPPLPPPDAPGPGLPQGGRGGTGAVGGEGKRRAPRPPRHADDRAGLYPD